MGTVTDRHTPVYYLPVGMAFSIALTEEGLEISAGVAKLRLFNAAGKDLGIAKFGLDASQVERDTLIARLAARRGDFEAAEPTLSLLPFALAGNG